jgi:hypothetical protein
MITFVFAWFGQTLNCVASDNSPIEIHYQPKYPALEKYTTCQSPSKIMVPPLPSHDCPILRFISCHQWLAAPWIDLCCHARVSLLPSCQRIMEPPCHMIWLWHLIISTLQSHLIWFWPHCACVVAPVLVVLDSGLSVPWRSVMHYD